MNDLKEFKKKIELFYYDNIKTKPNNENHIKDLAKRKVVFDTAQELYNKLLSIYKTQYDKITKTKKKRIKTLNIPENLSIDLYLDKDYLPPMPALEGDEKVKLVPEETTAERIKKNTGTA